MNIQVHLYKDSDCDLCKLMQQELMENPPAADVYIFHVKHESSKIEATKEGITEFPTIIVLDDDKEISRHTGFVDSKTIDKILKEYETECVV